MLILKLLKVLCFNTLLQVLILKGVRPRNACITFPARDELADRGATVKTEDRGLQLREIQIVKGNLAQRGALLYGTNIQESNQVVSRNLL